MTHEDAGAQGETRLGPIVDALTRSEDLLSRLPRREYCHRAVLPSRHRVVEAVDLLRAVLFPAYHGHSDLGAEEVRLFVGSTLHRVRRILAEQIQRGLGFACEESPESCVRCEQNAQRITSEFLGSLPEIHALLVEDVEAAYAGDPAAKSPGEAVICYPGVAAVTYYRLAHALHGLGVPLLPRIVTEHAHSVTGIDIHPGATIGRRFFIDHGTGVVIGETSVIGARVRIYQGVTLGAKSFSVDEDGKLVKGVPRHPIVEDDVIVYSGATILGRVTIGRGSIIGGNVWLTRSVPPHSRITQAGVAEEPFQGGSGI